MARVPLPAPIVEYEALLAALAAPAHATEPLRRYPNAPVRLLTPIAPLAGESRG